MLALLYTLHVLICIFLILVVLLQQGKGADLSVFGGGGTMTAFGARGAATVLHKLTVFSFVAFIVTTMMIGIFLGDDGSSVMSDLEAAAAEQESMESADGEEATEVAEPVGALEAAVETPEAAAAAAAEAANTDSMADDIAEPGTDEAITEDAPSDG